MKKASKPAEPVQRVRILIVDDHPLVRHGLIHLITSEPEFEICGEADSLVEGMRLYRETQPDLVVTDLSLKDGNGIELIKEIKARQENAKILVTSIHDESVFAERALRAGAAGYVNKQNSTEVVIEAIRQVLGGRIYLSSHMTDQLLTRAAGRNKTPGGTAVDTLSDRELEVFELMGRGLTTKEIAEKLYLSPKTVDTYRENIKRKLNLKNNAELNFHAVQWTLQNA
ncbi:MAG TPA: response regulator transcription factor [Planctomycetaceae bacterium]|nr:response regulator transcription factor [Planctomycetaceae bacterium]